MITEQEFQLGCSACLEEEAEEERKERTNSSVTKDSMFSCTDLDCSDFRSVHNDAETGAEFI